MAPYPVLAFHFNIHGIVRGEVSGPEWLIAPVVHELARYAEPADTDDAGRDLKISLGYTDDAISCDIGGPGTMEWEGKHLIGEWRCRMSAPGDSPRAVDFRGNRASRFIVSKWIVEPALRVVMEDKGATMVHAAGLTDGKKAVLVAGPGGAGKTTWSLGWNSAGHPYLNDDFSISYNGKLKSYLTPMRLGAMNIIKNKALNNLSLTDKIEIFARTAVRQLSLGTLKVYFKIDPQRAINNLEIVDDLDPAAALWLLPAGSSSKPQRIAADRMAAEMTAIDRAEMHGFGEGRAVKDDFWKRHQKRLEQLLAPLPCYCLPGRRTLPMEASRSVDSLLAWLESS